MVDSQRMSREDVEHVLYREATCADRVIIANRKLVSRSEPPRSGFSALAELVRLDARLVDDAKCRGKRAASKEAALILAVGLRRGAGNSKLRFQLLAMRCAMVQPREMHHLWCGALDPLVNSHDLEMISQTDIELEVRITLRCMLDHAHTSNAASARMLRVSYGVM